MARLVVNPDTPDAWVQELPPGECLIGRAVEDGIAIDHPSISSTHCRITVCNHRALLTDLGSTNGTFVRGELVERAELLPGAVFRLGDIHLRFETDAPAEPAASRPGAALRQGPTCRAHPRAAAKYFCGRCSTPLCEMCVQTQRSPQGMRVVCRKCGTGCGPLAPGAAVRAGQSAGGLLKSIPGAFLYPLQGNGFILLIGGGIFFILLGFLPLIGLLLTGYLFNYAKAMVATTGIGEDAPPDWPDFSNWFDDMVMPYLELVVLVIVTFGPALVANAFLPPWHPGVIFAVVYGAAIAPMALLALAMLDSFSALNPVSVVWSILRIPGAYTIAAVPFGVVITAYLFSDALLRPFVPNPFLNFLLQGVLNLYLLAVAMRIIGLLYRAKRDELGW